MAPVEPKLGAAAFDCPSCGVRAQHRWFEVGVDDGNLKTIPQQKSEERRRQQLKGAINPQSFSAITQLNDKYPIQILFQEKTYCYAKVKGIAISRCEVCEEIFIWTSGKLIWPQDGNAPAPDPDLPREIQEDYNEARAICSRSPRAAAALLRLCIEKLCIHLGAKPSATTDQMIQQLVSDGLPREVEDALHVVRVVGNESVHPGNIDLRDDFGTAASLFFWVNYICRRMISEPNALREAFNSLPEGKRERIERRRRDSLK